MAHVGGLNFFNFENGKELVLAQFEKGVAFAPVELFQIENILIERDRFLDDRLRSRRDCIRKPARSFSNLHRSGLSPKRKIDMDEFSYLSVLISVILGLAVTQILKGFRGILLSRARVRIYWPVIAWAALLLLICSQNWWSMFGMRNRHDWTFLQFTIVLLNTVFIYMMTALVFPDFFGEGVVDLKENFYAQRGWFFTLAFSTIVISVCKDIALDGRLPNTTNLIFHVIFGVTLFIGALTRSERYHKGLVVFGSALFVVYIVVLFGRIQ